MPRKEPLYPHVPKSREPVYPRASPHMRATPTWRDALPSTKKPFIKVGERVRFIGSSRGRYETWPKDAWLEKGVIGTVKEYHLQQPAVRAGGEYFEALPPYAVVRWDFGGDTVIDPDDEGKRWERIHNEMFLPFTISPTGTCYQDAWRFLIKEGEGHLVHGTVWSKDKRIGHAWIETETGYIWEPETKKFYSKLGFENAAAPVEQHRYTPTQASVMAARTKSFGPWTDEEVLNYLKRKAPSTSNISQEKSLSATEPIIHEATSENPDPTDLMPVDVTSAFPEGAPSTFNPQEKAQIDRFINEVPDKNDTGAINYWLDWGDKKVYIEGWIDKCLAGTGFFKMEEGEWDTKIKYMVACTHEILPRKQKERNLRLIEGGFREFDAGSKRWLYGVTWGVYSTPQI